MTSKTAITLLLISHRYFCTNLYFTYDRVLRIGPFPSKIHGRAHTCGVFWWMTYELAGFAGGFLLWDVWSKNDICRPSRCISG